MSKVRTKQMRVDIEFDIVMREIGLERVKRGISDSIPSPRRITRAMLRHEGFEKLKEDLIVRTFKDE